MELANVNADNQVVISGDKIAIARAADLALARGARKAVPLPVSGAFHSSLMADAKDGLIEAMENLQFKDPKMPIVGNCDSSPLINGDQIRQELVDGLCQCVQWKNSVRYMVDSGVSQFVEYGAGGVLAGEHAAPHLFAGRQAAAGSVVLERLLRP